MYQHLVADYELLLSIFCTKKMQLPTRKPEIKNQFCSPQGRSQRHICFVNQIEA